MDIEKILDEETKLCPECAETIKFKAKKCRHCQAQLDPVEVDKLIETRHAELRDKKKELRRKRSKEILGKKHKEFVSKERGLK
jgi:tRNA(Ile2) C34 agmatinyltransferase TiaS